jgi:hypothetical protein
MRNTNVCRAWAVYRMTLPKNLTGGNVVCAQWEWDAIEAAHPGLHTLLHANIGTEQEAERLARGSASEPVAPAAKRPTPLAPLFSTEISPARDRPKAA